MGGYMAATGFAFTPLAPLAPTAKGHDGDE